MAEGSEEVVVVPGEGGTVTPAPSVPLVPPAAQTVPLERLQSEIAKGREALRGKEAAEASLAEANRMIEEYKRKVEATVAAAGGTTVANAATTTTTAAKPLTAEELQKLVVAQAGEMEFNKACNAAVVKGKATYSDFDQTLESLKKTSPFFDPRAGGPVLPKALVEAALETGSAEEVLYELGKNPSEADRIMSLPPIKQAIEVARFHDKLAAKVPPENEEEPAEETPAPEVSRAPAPIRPAASRGTKPAFTVYDTKNTSTADWIAQRDAEIARKRANGARR